MTATQATDHAFRDRLARRLLAAAAGVIAVATVAGFGGRLWWVLGLFSALRLHLLLASTAVAMALVAGTRLRGWRVRSSMGAAIASLLANSLLVAPLWIPVDQGPTPGGPAITVLCVNLHVGNHRLDDLPTAAGVARMIEQSGAAVVVVEEITVHRLGVLSRALAGYRLAAGTGRPDAFGIALFVRRADESGGDARLVVESAREVELTGGLLDAKQVELRCRWKGRPLSLLGLHTMSAVHARSDRFRAAMLDGAAAWSRRQQEESRAVIVCGDFNATPWCAPFVDLLKDGELHDSQRGRGVQGTWPARLPSFLRIPIDQCLHGSDLVTLRREIGADSAGSDHLPLMVELQWR